MDDVTPIRQQYLDIKKKYPNMILFFRLGDFYETFDEDAQVTSKELDIVLTSRNVAKGNRIPMAGIPYHAVENYLGRLISKGFHVAICEQVGAQPVKGIFPREVVRIVTPGTILEPELLDNEKSNNLLCFLIEGNQAGISYTDISTGTFKTTQISSNNIISAVINEISRLSPVEIIIPANFEISGLDSYHLSIVPNWKFNLSNCLQTLRDFYKTTSLDGYGLREKPLSIQTAGVIIQYLSETQPSVLPVLNNLSTYSLDEFLILDSVTRRNLELITTIRNNDENGSLLKVLDRTKTAMGHRLIRDWIQKPLISIDTINERYDKVETLANKAILRTELSNVLNQIGDIERMTNRILAGQTLPRELLHLKESLNQLPFINQLINNENLGKVFLGEFTDLTKESKLIEESIDDDCPATLQNIGIIKPGFSKELDQIMETTKDARQWIANLEEIEKKKTGIKTLKVGYNKVFGYYIEVSRAAAAHAPSEYIRKQTLVNAERFITSEMKEYETIVQNAEDRIHELELRLFRELLSNLTKSASKLLLTAKAVSELDVLLSFAEISVNNNYIRPELSEDASLEIRDSRHPVVEQLLEGGRFIPNNAIFEKGELIQVITGPNMSGKSTYLRQVALIVLMAQIGCFVPASKARIGIVDRIFTRIGAQDEISSGQSTFMVEMTETAAILNNASNRSLLILDEIGRGTSTYDGVAIAWSVIEHIHNHPSLRARTLFATHYHELIALSDYLPGVKNYNVAVIDSDGKIVFMHKIIPGGSDKSYGIHVAQLAGMPKSLIQRSYEIMKTLESTSGNTIQTSRNESNQLRLFPENNPFFDEFSGLDLNTLSPLEALNKLYEWKNKYFSN